MSFNIDACIIKQVWCGEGDIPFDRSKYYSKQGTKRECLKKGFGAGSSSEKKKHLPITSLQNIPYIGSQFEDNFRDAGIYTIPHLMNVMKNRSKNGKQKILKEVLVNSDGTINYKAYNSVIRFLFEKGLLELPNCKKL